MPDTSPDIRGRVFDTFDGAKLRFLNQGKKRRSVSTLSIPRASDRGVEWVDFANVVGEADIMRAWRKDIPII